MILSLPILFNTPSLPCSNGDAYRYGFQGQETDDEIRGKGNSVNYKYRMHDARIGRFFAVDPLAPSYPHNSPYAFSENIVVNAVELEGREKYYVIYSNVQAEKIRAALKVNNYREVMRVLRYGLSTRWTGPSKGYLKGKQGNYAMNRWYEYPIKEKYGDYDTALKKKYGWDSSDPNYGRGNRQVTDSEGDGFISLSFKNLSINQVGSEQLGIVPVAYADWDGNSRHFNAENKADLSAFFSVQPKLEYSDLLAELGDRAVDQIGLNYKKLSSGKLRLKLNPIPTPKAVNELIARKDMFSVQNQLRALGPGNSVTFPSNGKLHQADNGSFVRLGYTTRTTITYNLSLKNEEVFKVSTQSIFYSEKK